MSFAYLPINVGVLIGPGLGALITRNSPLAVFPASALLTAAGVLVLLRARRQAVALGPESASRGESWKVNRDRRDSETDCEGVDKKDTFRYHSLDRLRAGLRFRPMRRTDQAFDLIPAPLAWRLHV